MIVITRKELKNILHYDKKTGIFTSKVALGSIKKNQIMGCVNKRGYILIGINKKTYRSHLLAWPYSYGEYPTRLDHKNHIKTDNRIDNLRKVTQQENCKNQAKPKNNTSDVVGVHWIEKNKRWRAYISIDKKRKYLGCYASFSDAVDARKDAEILYGYHENHGKAF